MVVSWKLTTTARSAAAIYGKFFLWLKKVLVDEKRKSFGPLLQNHE
jgi:hypothetical protein